MKLERNLVILSSLLACFSKYVTAWQPTSPFVGGQKRTLGGHARRHYATTVRQVLTDNTAVGGETTTSTLPKGGTTKQKIAVLLCPAQFCVPGDYTDLWPTLSKTLKEGDSPVELAESSRVVPLSRLDWIKVARQLPTMEFVQAKLPVRPTLYWYFEAMEQALADILAAEGPDVQIAIVGHSIGGWVARAFLGGLSQSASATFLKYLNM